MRINKLLAGIGAVCLMVSSYTTIADVTTTETDNVVTLKNKHIELAVDLNKNCYSLKNINTGELLISDAGLAIGLEPLKGNNYKTPGTEKISGYAISNISNELGAGKQLVLSVKGENCTKLFSFELYDDNRALICGFGLDNSGAKNLTVYYANLASGGVVFNGKTLSEPKALNGGAGDQKTIIKNTATIREKNSLMLTGKVDGKRRTIVAGGIVNEEFIKEVEFIEKNGVVSLQLLAWDPVGRRVDAGSTYISPDKLYLNGGIANPFQSLEKYAWDMRTLNNVTLNYYNFPTFCGWAMSNKRLGDGGDHNNSPALVKLAKDAKDGGFLRYSPVAMRLEPDTYHNEKKTPETSQGWFDDEHYLKNNRLRAPYDTFKKFSEGLEKEGAIPFSYVQVNMPARGFAKAHPDWLLEGNEKFLDEKFTKHSTFRWDTTNPEFYAYMVKVWKRHADAGLQGIKHDYPQTGWFPNGGFSDPYATTTSAYKKWFQMCRDGLGPKAYIHERALERNKGVIGGTLMPALDVCVGVADLQRVSRDNSHLEAEMIVKIALRWYKNRVVMGYYPDCKTMIMDNKDIPVDSRRTILTLMTLICGRLELATPYNTMSDGIVHDLSRVFPTLTTPKSFRPVDMLMGKQMSEVYVYDVSPTWSQVILFNTDSQKNKKFEPRNVVAPLSGNQADTGSLGLDANKSYYVYDFWNDKLVGKLKGSDTLSVELGSTKALIYSVREVSEFPQVISTDRHILQGQFEISDVAWNASSKTLTGFADVIEKDPMVITVACNGLNPTGAKSNKGEATIVSYDKATGLCKLKLSVEEGGKTNWELTF